MDKRILALLLALVAPSLSFADTAIEVDNAWARETPPLVTTGAAYMSLLNQGTEPERLIGARSDIAAVSELHTHLREDNVMKMRRVEAIELKPEEPVLLQPGGLHLMLIGLKQPLVHGQTFSITLHFEKAGDIMTTVAVRKP